jgi:vacuolar protein-sorting-associated protein 4
LQNLTDSTIDEKNARQKQMIHEKAKEYMERAEKLKKHITEQESGTKKGPAAIGANGKPSAGGGKGK